MDGRGLDAALLALAKSQHGVVSNAQARALGATPAQLRHRHRAHGWQRILPGIAQLPWADDDFFKRAHAAALWAGPGCALTHESAAHLWGLVGTPPRIDISSPNRLRGRRSWVRPHFLTRLPRVSRRTILDLPVTSLTRTFVDLAALGHRIEDLAENALREGRLRLDELRRALASPLLRGTRGVASVRVFLADRAPVADKLASALEHRAYRLFVGAGLPQPECQHVIRAGAHWIGRVDFAWPEHRVVVEADSHAHHSSHSDWHRDLARHNALLAAGWRSLRLTWRDVQHSAPELLGQLRTLLGAPSGSKRVA